MNSASDSRGIWAWDIVKYVTLGSLLLFAGLILIYGYTEEGVRQQIRWSARISFVLFVLAFGASGIHFYFKNSLTWWMRMNRKYLGISFAIIHLLHLGSIVLLQLSFHPVFDEAASISLMGGGAAYFFIVAMLLTSFESFSKYLSKGAWKTLHKIGGYWIWIVFLVTYHKRTDEPWHWTYVVVLLMILLLRLYQNRNNKSIT